MRTTTTYVLYVLLLVLAVGFSAQAADDQSKSKLLLNDGEGLQAGLARMGCVYGWESKVWAVYNKDIVTAGPRDLRHLRQDVPVLFDLAECKTQPDPETLTATKQMLEADHHSLPVETATAPPSTAASPTAKPGSTVTDSEVAELKSKLAAAQGEIARLKESQQSGATTGSTTPTETGLGMITMSKIDFDQRLNAFAEAKLKEEKLKGKTPAGQGESEETKAAVTAALAKDAWKGNIKMTIALLFGPVLGAITFFGLHIESRFKRKEPAADGGQTIDLEVFQIVLRERDAYADQLEALQRYHKQTLRGITEHSSTFDRVISIELNDLQHTFNFKGSQREADGTITGLYACSKCPEGDLLHVPEERYVAEEKAAEEKQRTLLKLRQHAAKRHSPPKQPVVMLEPQSATA